MKKGALELSANALVIIILAFAMLGAGLFFIRYVQGMLNPDLPPVVPKDRATADNPIVFKDELTIKYEGQSTVDASFYNKNAVKADNAVFRVTNCDGTEKLPSISTVAADVDISDEQPYKLIIKEQGAAPGSYVCVLGVVNSEIPEQIYEAKQFILTVIS